MKRRAYLAVAGAFLAGCLGGDDSEAASTETATETETETPTPDPTPEDPLLDDFSDLSRWSVEEGSLTADSDRATVGEQSALLSADSNEDRVQIKRTFDSLENFTDGLPALAVTADADMSPLIQLTDRDGDRLLLRTAVRAGQPLVARDFGVVDTVGSPDLSAIDNIKLSVWAGDRELQLWCDELHPVSRFETGTVLLQFDYGTESTYTEALPILESHGYPATAFVPTARVGADGRLEEEHLEALQDAGWTIGSQGTRGSDLTDLSDGDQRAEIETAFEWLSDNGFTADVVPFAYPLGRFNEATLGAVSDTHDLAFTGGYPVCGALTNPHLCPRATNPSGSEGRQLLEWTAELGALTVLTYNDLEGDSLSAFETTIDRLADLEAEGRLEVIDPETLAESYLH